MYSFVAIPLIESNQKFFFFIKIDQKGAEGKLEKAFSDVINSFRSPFVMCVFLKTEHAGICLKKIYSKV